MLDYDDNKWKGLNGGYGVLYNPTIALKLLDCNKKVKKAWGELWQELHHQGDLGEASYAAVPHLVRIHKEQGSLDWNLYALVSVIEVERHRKTNPALPKWLELPYHEAWQTLFEIALKDLRETKDEITIRSILGAIALSKGLLRFGALISELDDSEISEYLDEYMSWSDLYRR